jgi:hypothetical protein
MALDLICLLAIDWADGLLSSLNSEDKLVYSFCPQSFCRSSPIHSQNPIPKDHRMNIKINGFLTLILLIGISVCVASPVPVFVLSGICSDLAGAIPAQLADLTKPGDLVLGIPNDNDWPGGEAPPLAIDNSTTTKYLHFGGQSYATGFQVTPSAGKTVVVGLTFTTANDAPERDPISYELSGSNTAISGPWTLIATGEITDFKQAVAWPRFTMNSTPIRFSNSTSYLHYQVMFPTVRSPGGANSMQIAEVELLGGPEGGWPPEVNAGTDQVMILPNSTLQLDGTVTYYGSHPELLTIQWSAASAPSGVSLDSIQFEPDATSEDPKVILPQVPGVYSLRLSATDGTTQAEDTVQIALAESVYPTGDLNHDCIVNLADLLLLASVWTSNSGGVGSNPADINGQDGVNLSDFSLMAEKWLIESPQVIINEFMAINNSKYDDFQTLSEGEWVDEDGDSSDWIELLNVTHQPISLNGWYLTKNPDKPKGWELPDITLDPGAFLIIAASGKDRNDPDAQLHTDFDLDGQGYLALVKPDGKTVVHSFAYPQQFAGISYGLMTPLAVSKTLEMVAEGASAYAKIPTDNSLALNWINPDFVATGWKTGFTGVGFDTESTYIPLIGLDVSGMYNVNASVYIRIPFEIQDLTGLKNLTLQMKYDDGFIAYLNSTVPIQTANAPSSPTWNSRATTSHDDALAMNFVDYPLAADYLDNLRIGKNVLAIHGLNARNSSDFLISPRLTVQQTTGSSTLSAITGFMPNPTPNDNNTSGLANLGPTIRDVTDNPTPPAANTALPITAQVTLTMGPINSVQLHYRVNFDAEAQLSMRDDGASGDAIAGDGIYTAIIPGTAITAGQMVRWYVTATDTSAVQTREPMFLDPTNSPQYFGTVVVDPFITTNIGVFYYFVENTSAEGTDTGTRASVFYLNEFYDNILVKHRGGNTTQGRKYAFNNGHFFRFDPAQDRADEINLNEQGADPTYLRPLLSWETYAKAGQPASIAFPLHVMRNGIAINTKDTPIRIFIEEPDRHLLRRVGLDDHGALYKSYCDLNRVLSGEVLPAPSLKKVTRKNEDFSDVYNLANGIAPDNPQRDIYLFDNINIPAMINFLAASVIIHENDHTHKNFFLYRDTEHTGEWMFLPWDKDLTFGINNGLSGIVADMDYISGTTDVRSPSHPFYGDSTHQKVDNKWNKLTDAIMKNPVARQMYLRRLRTLMDQILQPTSNPLANRYYEKRIDEWVALLLSEPGYSSLTSQVDLIKTQYLPVRRRHFFEDHSINNPTYRDNAGIPDSQPTSITLTIGDLEYNPASGNQDEEYIQLINPQSIAVDISDWKIANAVTHTFPAGTVIPAGGALYVTPNALAFRARATSPKGGEQRLVQGNYSGHLSSWGGTIELYNAQRVMVTSKSYAGNPSDAQRYLRISELMYHPQDPAAGSAFDAEAFEYIELANIGDQPVSLTGVQLTNGVLYAFADGTALPAHEYLLIVKNPDAMRTRYSIPEGVQVFGPYQGGLANSGETVKLDDATHSTIVEFKYDDDWYPITDGEGFSLTAADLVGTAHDDWDRRTAWRASTFKGGTPGFEDVGPAPNSIVINEILAHSHDPDPLHPESDWIELKNTTNADISISGWFLSDDNRDDPNSRKYEFPEGTIVPQNGFWLLYQQETFGNPAAPGCHIPFALSEGGETLYLFSGQDGAITGAYSTQQKFLASARGVTLGRYEKASLTNGYDFVPLKTPTPGDDNSEPLVGPVVLTEIMYNPAATDTGGEYIEIRNAGTTVVELMSWAGIQRSADPADVVSEYRPWKITGEVEFTFAANQTIPVGGFLIIAQNPAAFKAKYPSVPVARVLGPYTGKLSNGGGTVTLAEPGDHEWGHDQYFIPRDKVEYDDQTPWPISPDGGGPSLNRVDPHQYGNDPANWIASSPNPNS